MAHCSDGADENDCRGSYIEKNIVSEEATFDCVLPPHSFGATITPTAITAVRCDGRAECDGGKDEEGCNSNTWEEMGQLGKIPYVYIK